MTVQNFEHDRSAYDRPNQNWVCGWAADGGGCRLGPDVHGRCRTTHECRPVRSGDRWMCTRPTIAGGRCDGGPLPDGTCGRAILKCQPERSFRSKRGAMVSAFAVLMIGSLVVLIGGPWRGAFVSPGQLSTTHAQLDDNCGRCHSAADAGLIGVLQASFQRPAAQTESGNCLQCHSFGDSSGSPHSLPRDALDVLVQKANGREKLPSMPLRASLGAAVAPNLARSDAIACAVCHAEHRGRRFDLKRMDSMSCQSCHQQKFHSFSRGHPEFSAEFPTTRRTQIAFNHSTHYSLHFKEAGWAGDCLSCHQPDSNGARMVLGGFETTCGSCHHHRTQIRGGGTVSVFGLPAVDHKTLADRGLWIGDKPWPVDGYFEIGLSPFMKLLLSSDQVIARDLETLFDDPELLWDLSGAEDQVVEAAGRLLWAIKILIHDLLADDGAALTQRLTAAVGSNLTDAQLAALTGEPADISFGDHQTWRHNLRRLQEKLGDLSDEVSQYRANPGLLYSGRLARAQAAESPSGEGTATPAQDKPTDDELFGDDDDLFGEDEGDDLLGDKDELLGGAVDEETGQEDDLFGDDDDLLGDSGHDEPAQPTDDPAEQGPTKAQVQLEALRLSLPGSGGWFFDEDNFAVVYRPTGHADAFLRAWLTHTAAPDDTVSASAALAVFDELGRDPAPGRCIKCHSVDTIGNRNAQQYRVNWNAARPTVGERSFTKFVHRPHFNFQQFRDCTACHSIRTNDSAALQSWKQTYSGFDIRTYTASFDSMSLAQCTVCHTPSGAGDGCLTCHNYHVGSFESTARLSFSNSGGSPTP